jgi:ribosomal protein S18 acetylase RimI-like enzyme
MAPNMVADAIVNTIARRRARVSRAGEASESGIVTVVGCRLQSCRLQRFLVSSFCFLPSSLSRCSLTEPLSIVYREANSGDLDAIVRFQVSMARETEDLELDAETCRRGVGAVLSESALGRYFIADAGGCAIASLLITYEWSDWRDGLVWWIQSVYVEREHRRRGVYGGLYRCVKAMAENDSRIRGIRLYVDERNTAAQEVYRRLGMRGEHYRVFEWMKQF